jgi:retron-type reverse transcriptase
MGGLLSLNRRVWKSVKLIVSHAKISSVTSHADSQGEGTRPLGLPNFTEKLVQEVLRMILEAYYEPHFRDSSHGFRSDRGCHTALTYLYQKFQGTTWFIEGDIKGFNDNIDHEILMSILARDIHDGRLLHLIRLGLEAGIVEDWKYTPTFSGVPQGGILTPPTMLQTTSIRAIRARIEVSIKRVWCDPKKDCNILARTSRNQTGLAQVW